MYEGKRPVQPGEEPETIKKYLSLLMNELDVTYPMKLINQELWNHDRWDEPLFALCDALGYETGDDLLHAYGFFYPFEEPEEPAAEETETVEEAEQEGAAEEVPAGETQPTEEDQSGPEETGIRIQRLETKLRDMSPNDLFEDSFAADADYPYEAIQQEEAEKERAKREDSKGLKRYIHNEETRKRVNKTVIPILIGFVILILAAALLRAWNDRKEEKAAMEAAAEAKIANTTQVEGGSFSTSITLPAAYVDPEMTQKQYNALADELGYKQIRIRSDGSVTYTVTRAQQYEMQADAEQELIDFLAESVPSARYPDVTSCTYNTGYTEFTVEISNTKISASTEAFAEQLAYYCGKYNYITGTGSFNCKVTVVSSESGVKQVLKPKIPT